MYLQGNTDCCGIMELCGFPHRSVARTFDLPEVMKEITDEYNHKDEPGHACAHILYSDVEENIKHANELTAFIRKHKLGRVISTPFKINPNSENKLKVFLWSVNWKNLNKYVKGLDKS